MISEKNICYAIDVGYIICDNLCYDNVCYNKYTRGEEVRYGKKRDNYKNGYFECGIFVSGYFCNIHDIYKSLQYIYLYCAWNCRFRYVAIQA